MAEIYLARAAGIEGFEKHVVIKRILPQYAGRPRFVEMFLDEARLAARLHHQNIAQVYDIGQEGDIYYFAMEYLHGVDVRRLMKRSIIRQKPLPLEHALTIVANTAAALGYAHNATDDGGSPLEIVHRDVSPANIFVTYEGAVKLVDFGIARASQRSVETRTGTLKGKISYMSPEQCRGQALDRRSDIFSLGIVLYEITTQTRLFRSHGNTDYVIMDRIVNGQFDAPSARVTGYPEALERIVLKALAGNRADRYGTSGELLRDLERFAAERRIPLSISSLSEYVTDLFGREPEPWKQLEDGIPIDIDLDDDDWPRTVSTTGAPPDVNATAATVAGREWALPPPTMTPVPSDWAREQSEEEADPPALVDTLFEQPVPVSDVAIASVRRSPRAALIAVALAVAALAGVALAFALSTGSHERADVPPPASPSPVTAAPAAEPIQPVGEPALQPSQPTAKPAVVPELAPADAREAPAPEPELVTETAAPAPVRSEPPPRAKPATRRRTASPPAATKPPSKPKTKPPSKQKPKRATGLIDRTW